MLYQVARTKKILDTFDLDIIQRCLLGMFKDREYVTITRLRAQLHDKYTLDVKKSTLLRAIKNMGYK